MRRLTLNRQAVGLDRAVLRFYNHFEHIVPHSKSDCFPLTSFASPRVTLAHESEETASIDTASADVLTR